MSFVETLKGLVLKKPATQEVRDPRRPSTPLAGGRRQGEVDNPYLSARRTWNDHVGAVVQSRQTIMVFGILALLIALTAVGGVIHIGSQSKFIPYVIERDKLGTSVAVGPVQASSNTDPRVVHASIADWMTCARMVTPDVALQRKCVFKVYSMLGAADPALPKMNEWLNGNPEASPFKRAQKEMASIEVRSVIPQTPSTWQIEWIETIRDRQGTPKSGPVVWRALVTVHVAEVTADTSDEQLRNNPASVYVRDFSWSRIQ